MWVITEALRGKGGGPTPIVLFPEDYSEAAPLIPRLHQSQSDYCNKPKTNSYRHCLFLAVDSAAGLLR
jgi:hypothetical protein